jgi:hypothetical protein
VSDLDTNLLALRVSEVHVLLQHGDMSIKPESGVLWSNATARLHSGSFNDG